MTQVFDMARGCFIAYTLSPWEAVVAAHQQYDRKNFETWTYASALRDDVTICTVEFKIKGELRKLSMVSCGNFATMCEVGKEMQVVQQDYELEGK